MIFLSIKLFDMKIDVQFVSLPVSETLEAFTIKKLNKLAKKYDMIINVAVFFKKENDPKGKGKVCEMELSLYGPRIFASSNEPSFEESVVKTIKDLDKQLDKRLNKIKPYL